jgi:hypothetical protein
MANLKKKSDNHLNVVKIRIFTFFFKYDDSFVGLFNGGIIHLWCNPYKMDVPH